MIESITIWLRSLFYRLFQNELIRRVVKNSGYLFSATGVAAALSMLQGILVARLLGVENFGILGAITAFTSLINKLVSFRMGEVVVRYVAQYTEANDRPRAQAVFKGAAITEMLASLVAFGLIIVLAPYAAQYLAKDESTTSWFMLYGLIVLANLIAESSMGLLQIFDRFGRVAALSLVQSIVTISLVTVVYFSHGGMLGILISYLLGKTVGALSITIMAIREASSRWGKGWWRTPLSLLKPQRREMVSFAFHTNLSASLSLVNKDSELLWVSLFQGGVQTGYYKLALSLANVVQIPVSMLPQTTYPEVTREVARENWGSVRTVLRQGSYIAASYALPASILLAIFGYPLIYFLYTPEYLPAYPALLILLVGYALANIFYWRRNALLALGRADYPARLNLILAILKLIGILLLVPKYGYLASAGLLSAYYIVGSILSVRKVRSLLEERG